MNPSPSKPRIGCSGGSAKRLNERAIDSQWVRYLTEHAEVEALQPLTLFRMLGGSIERFLRDYPRSLERLAEELGELRERTGLRSIYMNVPALVPYLLMGRAYGGIDLGFLFIAHSIGSEWWLRQWLAIAPLLNARDVVLASSNASLTALRRISDRFGIARLIPLCADTRDRSSIGPAIAAREGRRLLSIGRLEDVKNIDSLLRAFAAIRSRLPDAELTIAGDYTGADQDQIERYRELLNGLVGRLGLEVSVAFAGPVEGEAKERLFERSDLLLNLSTDPGETFGYNLIEAKQWGMPAICVNWNGFRDVVAHGEDGYLIDCDWGGDLPIVDEARTADVVLRVLKDDTLRAALSRRAAQRALSFDYRAVFPSVIAAIAASEAIPGAIAKHPDVLGLLNRRMSELTMEYRMEHMLRLPFANERMIDIVSGRSAVPLRDWMPAVRPIIGHYAGRIAHAER
ncbi:glycosyltransferase [Cohnella sp. GCM10027633]|uniref:glycosyltransferase n=1 Tax=unclassified Cohnella TaxID=2636738 RepID=UPI00363485E3